MSYRPRTFDPLDLEIIDRVYESACARFGASWQRPIAARNSARGSVISGGINGKDQ